LKALLGDAYEEARIKLARSESPTNLPSSSKSKAKRKGVEEEDEDVFPMSSGSTSASQGKRAKNLYQDFNQRNNYGPRDFNGGVSKVAEYCLGIKGLSRLSMDRPVCYLL